MAFNHFKTSKGLYKNQTVLILQHKTIKAEK